MDVESSPLVGRDKVLHDLSTALVQGWNNQGGIIFIEGVAGMGKTMLLLMLQEHMRQFPEFTKITFTYGYCYESTGSQNAYQPFVEILETLTRAKAGQKNATKLMLALLAATPGESNFRTSHRCFRDVSSGWTPSTASSSEGSARDAHQGQFPN